MLQGYYHASIGRGRGEGEEKEEEEEAIDLTTRINSKESCHAVYHCTSTDIHSVYKLYVRYLTRMLQLLATIPLIAPLSLTGVGLDCRYIKARY